MKKTKALYDRRGRKYFSDTKLIIDSDGNVWTDKYWNGNVWVEKVKILTRQKRS